MSHFYVLNINLSKRRPYFIGLAIIVIITFFIWFNRTGLFSIADHELPVVYTKGNKNLESISLTFNLSWGDEKVHEILSVLEEYNVIATFFLSGEWAERHPEIVEKILKQKHEIGMLGYRYKSYVDQDIQKVRQDLYLAQDSFRKLGLENVRLLRAPQGELNEEIIKMAKNMGFTIVHWKVNSMDYKNPGVEEIAQLVVEETERGDIVLFHASDLAKQTAGALDIIVPNLQKRDLQMVTVSELISQVETESKLVH